MKGSIKILSRMRAGSSSNPCLPNPSWMDGCFSIWGKKGLLGNLNLSLVMLAINHGKIILYPMLKFIHL